MAEYTPQPQRYDAQRMRGDVSFGLRHPIFRAESPMSDSFARMRGSVGRTAGQFFGIYKDESGDLQTVAFDGDAAPPEGDGAGDFADDSSFTVSADVAVPTDDEENLPYSLLKKNGRPSIAIFDRHKTASRKNKRFYGWTDRDLLRLRGDVQRSLGKLMFTGMRNINFDDTVVEPIKANGGTIFTIGLVPESPWLEVFQREQEIAHQSILKGNGQSAPPMPDTPPHVKVIRLSPNVSRTDADALARKLKPAEGKPFKLPVLPLEFYQDTVIPLS